MGLLHSAAAGLKSRREKPEGKTGRHNDIQKPVPLFSKDSKNSVGNFGLFKGRERKTKKENTKQRKDI